MKKLTRQERMKKYDEQRRNKKTVLDIDYRLNEAKGDMFKDQER
jgi:hypothetical protein